jgi:CDGSH-type Zn-finger protein
MRTNATGEGADRDKPAVITPCRDGPLLVRGQFRLVDQDGNEIDAGRRTIALCRCGRSAIPPFCDGTHKTVRFRAPTARVLPADGSGRDGGRLGG